MKRSSRRRTETQDSPAGPTPRPPSGRLGDVPVVSFDEDERPSREDLAYGETIFNRGTVPLPRFLTGRRKRPKQ